MTTKPTVQRKPTTSASNRLTQRTLSPGIRLLQAEFAAGVFTILHDANWQRNKGSEFTLIFKPVKGGAKHG